MTNAPIIVAGRSRLRLGLGAVVVLVLAGLAIAVLASVLGSHGETTDMSAVSAASPRPITTASGVPSGPANDIYVHVIGAVAHPGLFVLRQGDRAVDAVAAAGGFVPAADQTQLNLARVLTDGEQIIVPVEGEAPPVTVAGSSGAGSGSAAGGKVNLNTADLTALEMLPRVGPAMAQRILDWRKKNGRFTAIEDLMSVTGIGDKTFDDLKDLVTI